MKYVNSKISVINVGKEFVGAAVLSEVNAEFEKGKIHGIIGRNGSGKTVLLKCICGLIRDYTGSILIDGKECKKTPLNHQDIGAIIETPGFIHGYSGYANLKFLANIRHRIGNDEIIAAMKVAGLDPTSRKHVEKYSLGMRQRLGIAQAIMEDPDILILDEPMNGLDHVGVRDMREVMMKLRAAGKTLLLASHNMEDIHVLCDVIFEMDAGRVSRIDP